MSIFDTLYNKIADEIAARVVVNNEYTQAIAKSRSYRMGVQKKQLKVQPLQFDDNLTLNYTGLVADRIVSQMMGRGVKFDFEGDTETQQEQYVNAALDANKQEILFHRAILSASEAGTGYLQIIPDSVVGEDGQTYPRLQLIDPAFVTMDTLPEDYEMVIRYTIMYKFTGADGKVKARKRVVEHNAPDVAEDGAQTGGDTWVIRDYIQGGPSPAWVLENETPWPYDFPPVLHWQNKPSVSSCYGEPDIDPSMMALQDRINAVSSNISKIVRLYAHPRLVGVNMGSYEKLDMGPDQIVKLSGTNADIKQLDPVGDMVSSLEFFKILRQSLFDNSRVVDIDSLQDKLGTLTNFGLKVLYQDNLALIHTKQELFGDALEELSRRLQILNNMQPVLCEAVWPDFLPVNEVEETQSIKTEMELGVLSKQTAASELGRDWEQESERIADERTAEQSTQSNIGAMLLQGFNNGQNNGNASLR